MRVVLRLAVGLMMSLFVLVLSNAQNAEGYDSHRGWFWHAKPVECGSTLEDGYYELTDNLTCSEDPAITITGPVMLDLRGHTLSCVYDEVNGKAHNGILINGNGGAKVWNGTVTHCDNGIRIKKGSNNEIRYVKAIHNYSRGIRIDVHENLLIKCLAAQNASQGIVIQGNDNKIYSCEVHDNCRDGIEIEGNENLVHSNYVNNNGNPQTCEQFGLGGDKYTPWYYTGIDAAKGSQNNQIKYNRAGCNLGCVGAYNDKCIEHERDFWDENVEDSGDSVSTNEWENNSIACKDALPEYSPTPPDEPEE
jgi:hypothetical protein